MALVAMLLVALGPLLTLARGGVPAPTWTEVCSAQGARWVAADADAASPELPGGMTHPLQHCPWCSLQLQTLALPPVPTVLRVAALFTQAAPAAFLRAPRTLHAWASAQARAPPAAT